MAKKTPDSENIPVHTDEPHVSVCPNNEVFPLPADKDYQKEFDRLKEIVNR